MGKLKKISLIFVAVAIVVAAVGWIYLSQRPPRQNYTAELFPGITYTRQARSEPRPLMVHIIEIDLNTADVHFFVTPGDPNSELELPARTTPQFVEEFGVQLAINGNFFTPFEAGIFLWDFYPHSGDPVNVSGMAISNGQPYSPHQPEFPVICFEGNVPRIQTAQCPAGTTQAMAGSQILVQDGIPTTNNLQRTIHPRTAVAVNQERTIVWLIVVDGRQTNYSEGVTPAEIATIAVEQGAYEALNFDGGGSTTMVMMDGDEIQTLNSPIHKRIPMWARPVGNHLGVYVLNEDVIKLP